MRDVEVYSTFLLVCKNLSIHNALVSENLREKFSLFKMLQFFQEQLNGTELVFHQD